MEQYGYQVLLGQILRTALLFKMEFLPAIIPITMVELYMSLRQQYPLVIADFKVIKVTKEEQSQITINGSTLNYNRAYDNGGGIFTLSSTVIVDDAMFSQNSAGGWSGGAIHQHRSNYIQVTNTVFSNNMASRFGGAILMYVRSYTYHYLIGCQFINNYVATGCGGAVYKGGIPSSDFFIVERNYYVNNTARSGGAVCVVGENSSVSVSGSSFVNNTAVGEGGGAIYSNVRYATVTLSSSTFTNNTASHCGVLDVDDLNHFSINFTNSVFTYNTATGQTIGGGVACIRNASINILNSVFKHNFANYHAGVFYIDESVTTVDGSLFLNNSAAVDGGVFYTYVHASDYIIRRSQFSENSAGDDGGVLFIGRPNSSVSIDETIFDFNSAADRGGVIALIASSIFMEINRTNIYNNTAEFGGVMSACNSQVTLLDDSLVATVDPLLSFCTLYEGDIRHFNITVPQEPQAEIAMTTAPPTTAPPTTDPPTTTAPSTTTASPTSTAADDVTTIATSTTETSEITETDPLTTLVEINSPSTSLPITTDEDTTPPLTDKAPPTTLVYTRYSNPTTTEKQTSTTELLDKNINQSPTRGHSTTILTQYLMTQMFSQLPLLSLN